jgi:uncharacterized paraquat-inducible protein A
MKKMLLYIVVSILLAGVLFFGLRSYGEAKAYERTTAALVAQMHPRELAEFQAKEWAEILSFGLYKNKKRQELEVLRKVQKIHRSRSMQMMYYSMALMGMVLFFYVLLSLRAFTFFGAAGAGIMLLFGLNAPIMMVTIHKEVEYLGDVVLSFESKGVLGSVEKLFSHGDTVVAGVILLFSVIIPAVKILSMMFVSVFLQSRFAHRMVSFFKMIGKWSMVDVFVVATFLVYLTTDKGDVSRAEVEVGLYFFLAYVIVSMLVSLSADRMLHQVRTEATAPKMS